MSDDETVVRERLSRLFGDRCEPALGNHEEGVGLVRPVPGDRSDAERAAPGPTEPPNGPVASPSDAPADPATGTPGPALDLMAGAGLRPATCPSGDLPPVSTQPASPPKVLGGPGAFDPGRRGVKALAAVAAVVVLGAAGWAWQSRPETEPIRLPAGATGQQPADVTATATAVEVVVAVAGKVRHPGLVRLPAGARVADAIAAAGGVQPGTDIALLNLARKVSDGELILVGVTAPPDQGGPPGGQPGAGRPAGGGKINLNTATLAQLDTLPGVGPVLAQRILDHRQRHGGFRSVADLRRVDGIGDARYEDLKDLVTV